MEKIWWKISSFFVVLIGLCSGFPIGPENFTAVYHTELLTGLIGGFLVVCGVVFLAACLCCKRRNGFKEFQNDPVVASSISNLDHGLTNPIANGEFTIFTPLSVNPQSNNNIFLANKQIVGQTIDYNHATADIRSWFDGTEKDFPRTKLKYITELGKGWFGRVVEGTAQNLSLDQPQWTPVVVRILEASATSTERAVFLHDAAIYRCGKHPHILQLLGRSLESVPLLLLQEFCPLGDLKKYLRDNQATAEQLLSGDLPLQWCCQLCSALKHLHDHKLTHPDLAARNCQLADNLSLRLGDYGLAASLYPEDYYQGAPAVPVRWCSPESIIYTSTTIQPKEITFESNIWSLGVTIWEIYECGAQPYTNLSDDDVLSQVLGVAGIRLSRPTVSLLYSDYLFRLLQLCWSTSESRPSVTQVHLMLTELLQIYENTKNVTHSEPSVMQDFDRRWDALKPNTGAFSESVSMGDVDLSDVTVLNMNLDEFSKPMSPSLNNLHGSLDNLAGGEMDSWLQKVATKTGDMSYVRGLSEAMKDLDNTLALENVSSSDSSHQPSPAPDSLPLKSKLEFKLGPTVPVQEKTRSETPEVQRTSSESETEDENWRKKVERGAYSEKVHQKSKSVTDLMVLTHIDCSESDSETPLPSLDYRVNYRNVRYAPKQNLENVSLMFGSEGNLLSIHDKFQEELRRLQEERKDSLLFVPESRSSSHSMAEYQPEDKLVKNSMNKEEALITCNEATYTEVDADFPPKLKTTSPSHRNPESLLDELSSPVDIQPANQVYNIFNVTVDTSFSPIHFPKHISDLSPLEGSPTKPSSSNPSFQVPKLMDLIQNNDELMDYIITKYDTPGQNEEKERELNNNQTFTAECEEPKTCKVDFDTSANQEGCAFTSTPCKSTDTVVILRNGLESSPLHFPPPESEAVGLDYSLNTWDNFLSESMDEPREDCSFTYPEESMESMGNGIINCNQTFIKEHEGNQVKTENGQLNQTFTKDEPANQTFTKEDQEVNQAFTKEGNWGEGWFLHPQVDSEVSGSMDPQTSDDSYVGFNMDDEVMAAIRNELLMKLPQAQGQVSEQVKDVDDWDSEERSEVIIRYNVYNVPLSPIPEESCSEKDSYNLICHREDSSDSEQDDWPDPYEEPPSEQRDTETQSLPQEDPPPEPPNRDTPSQDSCCSNDTLFNLEELTCVNESECRVQNEEKAVQSHCDSEVQENYEDIENKDQETNCESVEKIVNNVEEVQGVETTEEVKCDLLKPEICSDAPIDTTTLSEIKYINEEEHNIPKEKDLEENYLVGEDYIEHEKHEISSENDIEVENWNESPAQQSPEIEISEKIEVESEKVINGGEKDSNIDFRIRSFSIDSFVPVEEIIDSKITRVNSPKDSSVDNHIDYLESCVNDNQNSPEQEIKVSTKPSIESLLADDKFTQDSPFSEKESKEEIPIANGTSSHDYITDFLSYERRNSADLVKHFVDITDIKLTEPASDPPSYVNTTDLSLDSNLQPEYVSTDPPGYVNTTDFHCQPEYINTTADLNSHHEYVNTTLINCDTPDYVNTTDLNPEYVDLERGEHLYDPVDQDEDLNLYDALTDIRFTGPGDMQLMSTSFSESADIDEQDWDSGSDTRSSSSGEFIWKEGEHEESVKALRAAPQDMTSSEKMAPMDDIEEVSTDSSEDEDVDSPEFVPSAWDKYATPTKSALRSPEKTLEKSEHKKSKGVWFKKQKYHCVYEYPREPESPCINSFDLWQPMTASLMTFNGCSAVPDYYQLGPNNKPFFNLPDFTSAGAPTLDEEFFISSSTRPFESFGGLSSQFFPGQSMADHWTNLTPKSSDNVTPDSGMEDITPSTTGDFAASRVQPLKVLATEVLKQGQVSEAKSSSKDALGGLRHARNKLKLDLPPSPSAFTSTRVFTIEPPEEPITKREVPTFTTFGKSRFLVQHVDTPTPDEQSQNKNVSFEALPYKPQKSKIEVVRGEASLLDSADEDSGIESSTLERKKIMNTATD